MKTTGGGVRGGVAPICVAGNPCSASKFVVLGMSPKDSRCGIQTTFGICADGLDPGGGLGIAGGLGGGGVRAAGVDGRSWSSSTCL